VYVLDKEKMEKMENIDEKEVKNCSQEETDTEETVEEVVEGNDENIDCEPAFKIKSLEGKLKEQEEAYMRINAEYANYRRRTAEEKSTIGLYANEKVMTSLIPVIDNMERALDSFEDKENPLYTGVEMVYKQMMDAFSDAGMKEIPAEIGSDFDHNMHMAVMQEPSEEYEEGKITMVMQKGYSLGDKILRATMVRVSC